MIRQKRGDTLVRTIEQQYCIDLNCRGDTLLGNLLDSRGFDSLSQLLSAYRGRLTSHPRRRRIFLSFHAEDRARVQGFRLMAYNPQLELDFHDDSVREPINSENGSYLRQRITEKIRRCSVLVCLIGNGTAWREWVNWEIRMARSLGKGVCGIRLKQSYGRAPDALREIKAPIAGWDMGQLVAAIECAAARRS